MIKKDLIFRYLSFFIAAVFITAAFLNTYKNEKIKTHLKNYNIKIKKSYENAFEETKKYSDLIFYNNVLYDETLVSFYKYSFQNKQEAKEALFDYYKNKYYHLKTFGVKQVNFYFANNEVFLNMTSPNMVNSSSIYIPKAVIKANRTLEDEHSIEKGTQSATIRFVKPIFDDELKHLGSVELEFSLEYISNLMQKSLNFDITFLYDKKIISNTNAFKVFKANKKLLFDSRNNNLEQFDFKDFKLDSLEESLFIYDYKSSKIPVLFIPILNENKDDSFTYIFAYNSNKNSKISLSYEQFYNLLFISILVYFIFFILLYYVRYLKSKEYLSKKKYDDLLSAINKYVVLVETDINGNITYVTEAFCDICGYTKKELINQNVNIIRHPDISKRFFEKMWNDLKKNDQWEGEIKNLDKYGNSYWVKATIFPKYDLEGNIVAYTSIRVDITDTKQLKKINLLLKEDLSNKLNEIKMKDKYLMDKTKISLMGKLFDSVSHEWKKPISNISISLSKFGARLEKDDLSKEKLKKIHKKITMELKALSITLSDFRLSFMQDQMSDRYNVYSVVDEAIKLFRSHSDFYDININLNSSKEIYCFGVYNEIKHIIIYLLKNSIEQISLNHIQNPSIKISVIKDNNNVLIKYEDNTNINSKEIIEEVFSQDSKKSNKDRGLNLYIVKLLIEKTGSKIWFDNHEDKTSFYIKLVSIDRRKALR